MGRECVVPVGGTRGLVAFGLFTGVTLAFATSCHTALSAAGAGERLLARRLPR